MLYTCTIYRDIFAQWFFFAHLHIQSNLALFNSRPGYCVCKNYEKVTTDSDLQCSDASMQFIENFKFFFLFAEME